MSYSIRIFANKSWCCISVLLTTKDEESESLMWDVYFWIGSESSQDEYGVAAYKANELGKR